MAWGVSGPMPGTRWSSRRESAGTRLSSKCSRRRRSRELPTIPDRLRRTRISSSFIHPSSAPQAEKVGTNSAWHALCPGAKQTVSFAPAQKRRSVLRRAYKRDGLFCPLGGDGAEGRGGQVGGDFDAPADL